MTEENWEEKREHPRVRWRFVAKYTKLDDPDAIWEMPTVKDISQGGCYFYSPTECHVDDRLGIEIQFPKIADPMRFVGKVLRVDTGADQLAEFGVAVQFIELDEEKKAQFVETLNFFHEREKNS